MMIYLASDNQEHGVYFDLRKQERKGRGSIGVYCGLLGNGVQEVPVTVRTGSGRVDIDFGSRSALFDFIDEGLVRRALGDAVLELAA